MAASCSRWRSWPKTSPSTDRSQGFRHENAGRCEPPGVCRLRMRSALAEDRVGQFVEEALLLGGLRRRSSRSSGGRSWRDRSLGGGRWRRSSRHCGLGRSGGSRGLHRSRGRLGRGGLDGRLGGGFRSGFDGGLGGGLCSRSLGGSLGCAGLDRGLCSRLGDLERSSGLRSRSLGGRRFHGSGLGCDGLGGGDLRSGLGSRSSLQSAGRFGDDGLGDRCLCRFRCRLRSRFGLGSSGRLRRRSRR